MHEALEEAKTIILGHKTVGYYIAAFFFTALGVIISLWHSSRKRNPSSSNTPYRFSWLFLIWDNFKRACVTLIVMFILFRCFDLSNPMLMISVGVLVALFLDKVVEWIMNQSEKVCQILGMNRDKFPQKPAE